MKKEILSIVLPVFMLLGINTPAHAEPCTTKVNRICNFVFPKDGTVETEESYSTCQSIGQGWCGDGQSQRVQEFSLKNAVIKSPKKIALKINGSSNADINRGGNGGGLQSPDYLPEIPDFPTEDPITSELVFSGYICEMSAGVKFNGAIRLTLSSEPFCQGNDDHGFAEICFLEGKGSSPCPNEDNPAKNSMLYSSELKPALIASFQRSMLEGQRIKVYRLSNTEDYPNYSGPLEYGNKVVFTAHHFQ